MPNYRVRLSGLDFNDASIVGGSINIATSVDIPGAELVSDTFTVIVDFESGACVLFSPADYDGVLVYDEAEDELCLFGTADVITGDLTTTPYGTPINLYDGNNLIGKFFVHDVARVGKTHYKINAMSAIGFLENTQHMGGVYINKTVSQLIDEIVNDAFVYQINAAVADQRVAGWLPIDTARNNLHKLLFAMGIAVTKDDDGDVVFTFLSGEYPYSVPDERIYIGGKVDYNALATAVAVTEHSFYQGQSTPSEQIFSNAGGVAANNLFVPFSVPYWDVQSSGLTIHDVGDNYAIVSGVGTLTGKPYIHETKVYQEPIPGATGIVPNVVTSDSDTLVNSLNALNVLDRLVAYYGSRKTVSADIILDSEKAGDSIVFTDAFGDPASGIIAQMDTLISTFAKAQCKIITDYTPTGQGNYYTNRVLIDASGTWTVPAGVTAIRIALVGGGTGGAGGYDGDQGAGGVYDPDYGEYGDQTWARYEYESYTAEVSGYRNQPLKKGGSGGTPGSPGEIYVIDAIVTPGEVITVVIGAGGAGGESNGGAGQAGTATTVSSTSLGSLSSDLGVVTDNGFMDVFSGKAFAIIGKTGYAGGNGGQTDIVSLRGNSGVAGLPGANVGGDQGGAGGAGASKQLNSEAWAYASGGGGGGAAYGHNGEDGGAGVLTETGAGVVTGVKTGDGGKGADADPPAQAYYGCGGDGGNGGGAGGAAGAGRFDVMFANDTYKIGDRGEPGLGSVGGAGGDGAVIIYY